MRKRIYEIIETAKDNDIASRIYDFFMILVILVSLVPIALKQHIAVIEITTTSIFIIDYFLRLITADYKLDKGTVSFIRYPFTPMAIIDLLSILPSLLAVSPALRILRVFRLFRMVKVFKAFKLFRYSRNATIILNVIKKQRLPLITVGCFAISYILIIALIIICVEPDTFPTYFDALYWATISLTTVGYGDIFASTIIGKTITMISSLIGIAIVALPSGIITAGYMNEINSEKKD